MEKTNNGDSCLKDLWVGRQKGSLFKNALVVGGITGLAQGDQMDL